MNTRSNPPSNPRSNSLSNRNLLQHIKNIACNATQKRLDGDIQLAMKLDAELDRLIAQAEQRGLGDAAVEAEDEGRTAAEMLSSRLRKNGRAPRTGPPANHPERVIHAGGDKAVTLFRLLIRRTKLADALARCERSGNPTRHWEDALEACDAEIEAFGCIEVLDELID